MQVQSFKQHAREVTDLCFDEQAEHLASGAADGSIAVRPCGRPAAGAARTCRVQQTLVGACVRACHTGPPTLLLPTHNHRQVYGLYSDEVQRLQALHPVTTVALDPRYASRKTREVVYGSAAGALVLSSKVRLTAQHQPAGGLTERWGLGQCLSRVPLACPPDPLGGRLNPA